MERKCKDHIERDEFLKSHRGGRNENRGINGNYFRLELTDVIRFEM